MCVRVCVCVCVCVQVRASDECVSLVQNWVLSLHKAVMTDGTIFQFTYDATTSAFWQEKHKPSHPRDAGQRTKQMEEQNK